MFTQIHPQFRKAGRREFRARQVRGFDRTEQLGQDDGFAGARPVGHRRAPLERERGSKVSPEDVRASRSTAAI